MTNDSQSESGGVVSSTALLADPDKIGWINGEEKQHDKCCGFMDMAIKCAIIRENNGPRFGPDVLPSPLTIKLVACPWCGAKSANAGAEPPAN